MKIKPIFIGSLLINITIVSLLLAILKLDVIRAELYKELVMRFGSKHIIFLGDSLTRRNSDLAMYTGLYKLNALNYATDGYTLPQVYRRLVDKALPQYPCLVVIMAGTNRQDNDSVESNVSIYEKILDKAAANSTSVIVLQTPLTQTLEMNNYIQVFNQQLETLTQKKGVSFFPTNFYLASKNKLKGEYSSDGVHLNNNGYEVLNAALIPFLKQNYVPSRAECNNIF